MSEEAIIAALTDIGETFSTFTGLWVSVTFAYLTVAYIAGKDLTRFQAGAVTGLYVVSSSLFALSALANSEAWLTTAANSNTVFTTISVAAVY